jgi:hypothetical protein
LSVSSSWPKVLGPPAGERLRQADASDVLSGDMVHRAALPMEAKAMMIRSGGFYHDGDPPGPEPLSPAELAILLLIVSVLGAAITLVVRALLLTAG